MPPRAKPVQALERPNTDGLVAACKFRPEFARLELDDQLAMIRNCIEVVGPALWTLVEKHDRLADYIEAENR